MPHPYTGTRVKRGKWSRYNARRAANRDADRAKRLANRMAHKAESDALMIAHAEQLAANPAPFPVASRPAHKLRVTVDIDGQSRTFSASFIEGVGWIGDSGNTITKAIRLVMANAVSETTMQTCSHRRP